MTPWGGKCLNWVVDPVQEQYESYPYPQVKWLGKVQPAGCMHASYETGSSLCLGKKQTHENKKILLLGCGTMEPYVLSSIHPLAQITAVDLSARSLKQAKLKTLMHGQFNVRFINQNLVSFGDESPSSFDYIHCFGVLHHLPDPKAGFAAVKKLLAPEGFARIMVYSKSSRRYLGYLREMLLELGFDLKTKNAPREIKRLVMGLPESHPIRNVFDKNEDSKFDSGIIDSAFHACENPFSFEDLSQTLKNQGLKIAAWDFSAQILNLLSEASGATLDEKIKVLEQSGAWQAPFTFWVTHEAVTKIEKAATFINPLWLPDRGKFWSPVLKRMVDVDLLKIDDQKYFDELFNARVLLRGN